MFNYVEWGLFMKHLRKYTGWVIAFVFAVAVIAVYKTFDNVKNIVDFFGVILSALGPFVIAFIIAYLLNLPIMKIKGFIDNHTKNKFFIKHSYGIGIFIVYIIAIIFMVITLSKLIPALYSNILDLYTNFPNYWSNMINYLNGFEIVQRLKIFEKGQFEAYDAIYNIFNHIDFSQFSKYASGIMSFTSGIVNAFIAFIASIYMLLDKARIQRGIIRLIALFMPEDKLDDMIDRLRDINDIFTSYIYSRIVCGIITGFISAVVLMILRVKYALMLGILIALLDLIPYFGSIISCVLSILITLITGGIFKAIYVSIALIIIQQFDGNILAPKIMGSSLEIRPITIIFGVSVGGTLFGFMGMLLSVPILAVIKSILSAQLQRIEKKKALDTASAAAASDTDAPEDKDKNE